MSKPTATMWTLKGCPDCARTKKTLLNQGYQVEERYCGLGDWEGVKHYPERDDILALLQMQNGAFPVVRIEGEFIPLRLLSEGLKAG